MARWQDIVDEEPEFADRVGRRFEANRHKVIATLRKDGSPRISGIEADFKDGDIVVGMMAGSLKERDVARDPRIALHSATEDPSATPSLPGVIDAKLAGRAVAVARPANRKAPPGSYFTLDISEVVLISLGEPADHLVIETWRAGRGLERIKRA